MKSEISFSTVGFGFSMIICKSLIDPLFQNDGCFSVTTTVFNTKTFTAFLMKRSIIFDLKKVAESCWCLTMSDPCTGLSKWKNTRQGDQGEMRKSTHI